MNHTQLFWFIARAAGVTAWIFSASSVFTGLVLSSKSLKQPRPNWQLDLHRHQGTVAIAALALHLGALVADSFIHVGILDVVVPLHMSWKPGPVAWGVVAMYALVVVEVSSLLRAKLSKRTWRAIHQLSFFVYVASTVHFIQAGTDRYNVALQWVILIATVVNVTALTLRLLARPKSSRGRSVRPAD